MRKILFCCITLTLISTTLFGSKLRLSENSKALAQIVLPDSSTKVEKTAATELKQHLDSVCNADFQIISHSKRDKNKISIFVGDSTSTREILACDNFATLGYDSIKMKTYNNSIALCGHPQRGSLYAVYSFLEDEIGIRWWSKDETFIPQKTTLEINQLNISYTPTFKLREALYKIAFDGVFASRLKQNGATLTRMNFDRPVISPEYGGCQNLVLFKGRGSSFHSHFEILPPKKYFKNHPQWYSLIDGKRVASGSQLCLTNDEMAQEYLKNIKELLRQNPLATSIQVSQNDWLNPCECDNCKKIDDENGSHAGTNLYFANKIAEGIEKEFPNVFIDTFAYQYTRKAPKKIKPRKNVLVRLCTIECSFAQPLEDDNIPQNKAFADDIKEWSKIAKSNLFVWDYVTNFRSFMSPHPNMNVLADNIKFFAKNSVAGVFEQGDAFCSAGDFVLLRNWVISHLMWNPNANVEKLFDEFLYGYYGKEVGSIFKQYLETIENGARKSNAFVGCFDENISAWLDTDTFNKAAELLDEASKIAEKLEKSNPEKFAGLMNKVRRERLSFDHIAIVKYRELKQMADREGKNINLPKNPQKALGNLIISWQELGVETWREFTTHKDFLNYQKNLLENINSQMILLEAEKKIKKSQDEIFALYSADIEKYSWKNQVSTLGEIFKDENSTIGYSTKIPLANEKEKIQIKIESSKFNAKNAKKIRVHLFAKLRADASNFDKKDEAFSFSLFKYNWRNVVSKSVKLSEISGENYETIELCDTEISQDEFPIFIAFRRTLDKNVKDIYIDKIFAK